MNRLSILAVSLLMLGSSPAQVQVAPASKIIRQIDVFQKGTATVDGARVRAQIPIKEGEIYTDEAIEKSLRLIYGSGDVENVDIQTLNVVGGVRVLITVTGRGNISEIGFLGNAAFDNGQLRKVIRVKTGDPVDDAQLTAAQQAILELYEKKGFTDALVTYDVTPSYKAGASSILFKIEEGNRGLIGEIRFEGNTALSGETLQGVIKSAEKLDNQQVIDDVRRIEQAYQDRGYVYVRVGYRREAVDADHVALVFEITEGGKYDVAAVKLKGLTVFTSADLLPGISIETNLPYSGTAVRNDERFIQDYYGSRGYADARVSTELANAGAGKLNVTYSVFEGTLSYIGKVNISGNYRTRDIVIRRELTFAPGEILNTVKLEAAQRDLENLGLFEGPSEANPLTVRPVSTETPGIKDVEINVVEKPTGVVNWGLGYHSLEGTQLFIKITTRNFSAADFADFRGDGVNMSIDLQMAPQGSNLDIHFGARDFLGSYLLLKLPEPKEDSKASKTSPKDKAPDLP